MSPTNFFNQTYTISVDSPAMPELGNFGMTALAFKSLEGVEQIGELFSYRVTLQTPDFSLDSGRNVPVSVHANVDFKKLVGKEFSIGMELDASVVHGSEPSIRYINGIVTQARYVRSEERRSIYEVILEPWLTLATRTTDYKIFQQMSVQDILRQVLSDYDYPFEFRTINDYAILDFQVQYGESDYAFMKRLMAEWGIYYFIEHSGSTSNKSIGQHKVILADEPNSHNRNKQTQFQQVPYYPEGHQIDVEHINHYGNQESLQSGQWVTDDYDFTAPRAKLSQRSKMPRNTGNAHLEIMDWPSDYTQAQVNDDTARYLTRVRMESVGMSGITGAGKGNVRGMVVGTFFNLSNHPHDKHNQDYLITQTQLCVSEKSQTTGNSEEYAFECWFRTIPASSNFRLPIVRDEQGRILKPRIAGTQTARVTGPANQSVWTDKYGRVKVHFHWDRYSPLDESSSCWIRVATPWSGGEMGHVAIPRIRQEVVLSFEEGDPDRPFIIGSVNNEFGNMSNWTLPSQAALTGIRSRELKDNFGNSPNGRSNHVVLDDSANQIQVQVQSEHLSSSLSLGYVTRIEKVAGRTDYRGQGAELRTDGHVAIRGKQGMLITTEGRLNAQSHLLDMTETTRRLNDAFSQHDAIASYAAQNQAQQTGDQDSVAQAIERQNAGITGRSKDSTKGSTTDKTTDNSTTAASSSQAFSELSAPHLVLASPAGIAASSKQSTHLHSAEHIALTSNAHTSISAKQSLLGSAIKAIRLFALKEGMKLISAQENIDIAALSKTITMLAKLNIEQTANRITMTAKEEIVLNGGGSYMVLNKDGITKGMNGLYTVHAVDYVFTGPANLPTPTLPKPVPTKQLLSIILKNHADTSEMIYAKEPYELYKNGTLIKKDVTDEYGHIQIPHKDENANYSVKLTDGTHFDLQVKSDHAKSDYELINLGHRDHMGGNLKGQYGNRVPDVN